MSEVTLGGDRLGSGGKNKVELRNFERSTHNIGNLWKSTIAPGTLVPFMSRVALPGDTFDIDLDVDVMTLPTLGPLFGRFKIQLDVFQVPVRLYNSKLHMNALGIGMKMNEVLFPQLELEADAVDTEADFVDNQHTNPSSILSYLGIRGNGMSSVANKRQFNAIAFLGYWDIVKQYYANKQEEVGFVIHSKGAPEDIVVSAGTYDNGSGSEIDLPTDDTETTTFALTADSTILVDLVVTAGATVDPGKITIERDATAGSWTEVFLVDFWDNVEIQGNSVLFSDPNDLSSAKYRRLKYDSTITPALGDIQLVEFPLENIDNMREELLKWFQSNAYVINKSTFAPYGLPFQTSAEGARSILSSQEGLAVKTYQSDLFNNWIQTEWIDGVDGISAITAVDTTAGSFTIDELNLSKKVYDMLNRIALSGGTYDDWLDAVYTHDRQRSAESPIYLGGLSTTLLFQEVVSTADTKQVPDVEGSNNPLGTLAGKGRVAGERKGGQVVVKVDEPSYIIGIASLTPMLDYSQGNSWDVNLKNMDDLHKPSLDQIGFQDLITDGMGWFDSEVDANGNVTYKSAGKQPAWINYMTSINMARGAFAEPDNQMFMTLNRRYSHNDTGIKDLTTYIDPIKFNYIFADARRDAQNFWMQISLDIKARRKMSAKVIPNL